MATQVRISGTLHAPRRIIRSTVSSCVMLASWKCVWMPLADRRWMCSSTHSVPAGMGVQHGRAGVVAVDGLLDLLFHRERDVLRKIRRHPLGAVWRAGDDELLLVLGKQRSIHEVHCLSLLWSDAVKCGRSRAAS